MTSCEWREEDGVWGTECDNAFEISEGGPTENKMVFCCFCGQKLEEFPEEDQYADKSGG